MKTGLVTCLGASLVLTGALVVACGGGGTPAPETPPAATEDSSGPEAPAPDEGAEQPETGAPEATSKGPPKPWKEMSEDEKKEYMSSAVQPKMGAEFTNFDAEKYAKVTCKTCHGPGVGNGTFAMPNPKLGKLPPGGDLQAVIKNDPPLANFMMRNVVPNMVELLGVEPYDPESGTGFGCYSCHTTK